MHIVSKRLTKWLVRAISVFLSEEKTHKLERWRRGREEFWKYQRCQYIFASYGKSGRTWVRVMISRYYQLVYKLPDNILMGFDNYNRMNRDIPKIFFTHDNYLRGYTGNVDSKRDFYNKKTVLLVRKPQDVAVSQFFQWKYRMRPAKKAMNKYPAHEADISVYDFVKDENQGLSHIIEFMNNWARELSSIEKLLVVRYEDLRTNPEQEMARIVEFLDLEGNEEFLRDTAEFASVENLRKKEQPEPVDIVQPETRGLSELPCEAQGDRTTAPHLAGRCDRHSWVCSNPGTEVHRRQAVALVDLDLVAKLLFHQGEMSEALVEIERCPEPGEIHELLAVPEPPTHLK